MRIWTHPLRGYGVAIGATLLAFLITLWTGSGGELERAVSVPDAPVRHLALTANEQTVVARRHPLGHRRGERGQDQRSKRNEGGSSKLTIEHHGGISFVRSMYLADLGVELTYRGPKTSKKDVELAQGPVATEQVLIAKK